MQTPGRKVLSSGSPKDMWVVVRDGSAIDVESTLALLKKNGGNINSRNAFGLTPLHIGTWRNHIPIVKRLLAAGADPNARDGESGWSSLHRALHFGHLAMASILLQSGASMTTEDSKYRTPVDLLSGPVMQTVGNGDNNAVVTELFSWGSGVNYQLGTGNTHIQKLPCKVDSLQGSFIKLVSSAKFHSVAVTKNGEVYTWGFGRGGRLGHPDFDIHSGQAAVITPRQVTSGLGGRRVKTIAAAKHHTVAATEGGEVFTWGSNREGQLGYTSVDTQPTPRRVNSLKTRIVAVAAANKHTAVLSECGEVFTWGCNKEGQLGYGTSNSGSNYTPRLVEYLKRKVFIGVSAAKYHTIVLGADGEVFTWGHRLVTPRRVVVARNIKKSGSYPLKFHRKQRLHVVSIGAGMVHSVALTDDGALFYWVSSDPDLRCQQLHSLCGRSVVSISAGKYWIAGATSGGDVYMWDGKKRKNEPPHVTRLHGVKRATSVSVGETHILIITSLYHPPYPCQTLDNNQNLKLKVKNEVDVDELNDDFIYDDTEYDEALSIIQRDEVEKRPLPSLKSLCEKAAAEYLVEPRSALQLLEIADSLEAHDLRKHCEDIVIRNLDYILTVSSHAIVNCSLDVLVDLEKSLDSRSSEAWSHRRLPPPTATFPAIINSEEEDDSETQLFRTRDKYSNKSASNRERFDSFLQPNNTETNQDICKQIRALRKKLQQIEMLEEKQSKGHLLDEQQIAKLRTRDGLERSLLELGVPVDVIQPKSSLCSVLLDGKGNKRADKKQKRKNKHMLLVKGEEMHVNRCFSCETNVVKGFSGETNIVKGFLQVDVSEVEHKEKHAEIEGISVGQDIREPPINTKKDPSNCKTPSPASSKKKNRKGGLSMFLSGALDDAPEDVPPPPPTPKSEGPAWGGATISKGSASLREILQQDEKGKTTENKLSGQVEGISDVKNGAKFQGNSLLISSPIPVVSARTSQIPDGERATPPWASSGTPPHVSRPSLRGIQLQQVKKQQSLSHSPKTSTTGFCVASGQGSPSDSSNRWFKPEVETPSSLRSIQIEEKAINDLKRFYSTVKIVKNHS